MQIDDKLISFLEESSFLSFSDDEKKLLVEDMKKILKGMSRLGELNTDGVYERSQPFDYVNSFREDETRPSFDRALILQNAPARNDETFIAPKTLE